MSHGKIEIFRYTGVVDNLSDELFIEMLKTTNDNNSEETLNRIVDNIPLIKDDKKFSIITELLMHTKHHEIVKKIIETMYTGKEVPLEVIKICLNAIEKCVNSEWDGYRYDEFAYKLSKQVDANKVDETWFKYFINQTKRINNRCAWYKTYRYDKIEFIVYKILDELLVRRKERLTYDIAHLFTFDIVFNVNNEKLFAAQLSEILKKVDLILSKWYPQWDYNCWSSYGAFYTMVSILPEYIQPLVLEKEIQLCCYHDRRLQLYEYCIDNNMKHLVDTKYLINSIENYPESKLLSKMKL